MVEKVNENESNSTELKSLNQINAESIEGRYLMAAIAKITTESQTDKTPDEVMGQLTDLQKFMYKDSPPVNNLTTENAILKEEINLRNEYYESKIDTLNRINDSNYAENARLREALEWNDVKDKLPREDLTCWLYSKTYKNIFLGCRVYLNNEGFFWAKSNGVTYLEEDKIITECEIDDYDITHWMYAPEPPKP